MTCRKDHAETDLIIQDLQTNQSGAGRHKCAACAYEKGVDNGSKKELNFDLSQFLSSLETSQKGLRRHRDPIEAYTLGFIHGLNGANNHVAIKNKTKIAHQMRDLGLHMVGKGAVNATFSEHAAPYSHAMAIVHVAHGFEILIKSKIVEEHPFLIFSKIPTESKIQGDKIHFEDLLAHGQTINYSELPHRLWATTGYKMSNPDFFQEFGKIRNQIIHFSVPNIELSEIALKFVYEVIEKTVNDWWDVSVLEYACEYDDGYLEYVFEQLQRLNIEIQYRLGSDGYSLERI